MSITSAVKNKISSDEISGSTGLSNIGVWASLLKQSSNESNKQNYYEEEKKVDMTC